MDFYNQNEQPKEDEGLVTYTYDHLDRLLYRNVFLKDAYHLAQNYSPLTPERKPKKLLYQDVYSYKGKNQTPSIKRVYQPVIEFIEAYNNKGTLTMTANFTCKSPVLASGFVFSLNSLEELMSDVFKAYNFYKSQAPHIYKGADAIGKKQYTTSYQTTTYIKAFCEISTGILFSKTITV